jgi:hypothetical protein
VKTYLKPMVKFLLASGWIVGLSIGTVALYHHYLQPASYSQLETKEQGLLLALETHRQEQADKWQTLHQNIVALQTQFKAQDKALSSAEEKWGEQVSRLTEMASDTHTMKTQLLDVQRDMDHVVKQWQLRVSRQTVQRAAPVRASATPKPKTELKPQTPPPFKLFGIQKRGSAYFAVIGQPNATTLSELSLLRQGEQYRQWQVVAITPSSITVSFQGKQTTLEVNV